MFSPVFQRRVQEFWVWCWKRSANQKTQAKETTKNLLDFLHSILRIAYCVYDVFFCISLSSIFLSLRSIPILQAVSKSMLANSSIGLMHKPQRSPNSFFQCLGLSCFIKTSAISPSSFKAWRVSFFSSSSFSNSNHLFFDMT
jgi:hypothetical protein